MERFSEDFLMTVHERLDMAMIRFSVAEFELYMSEPDVLPDVHEGDAIPRGYKLCRKCNSVKKIILFNKNKMAKDGCTSQCKECQKANANKSYAKNKHKRTWRKYYQEHKEEKREQSRRYYQEHKQEMAAKHAQYRSTNAGKKAMTKAHAKRAKSLKSNTGIPYTREMVIDRDRQGGTDPICYLCGKPITTGTIHLDHVIPVVMSGRDCFTNVACVHDSCNLQKSKDAREITEKHVEGIIALSEAYMDAHQDLFPEIFDSPVGEDGVNMNEA